jgi:hypothetical protein
MSLDKQATRHLLAELGRANLITESTPGRFRVHDLVRAYATELLHAKDPPATQREATIRLLDHYVRKASTLAEEHAALRRVATLVAHGATPTEVFDAVIEEVGRVLGPYPAVLFRYEPDGSAT